MRVLMNTIGTMTPVCGKGRPSADTISFRKLKIAVVGFGTSGHVGAYAKHFQAAGHDVQFYAYDVPIQDHGVPTIDISYGANSRTIGGKAKYLFSGLRLRRLLRQARPDLVYAHNALSGGCIAEIAGIRPVVIAAHGSDVLLGVRSGPKRVLLRYVLSRAALVQCVSSQIADTVRSMTSDKVPVLVMTHGVEVWRFKVRSHIETGECAQVLCMRPLEAVYDPFTIVAAFEILHRDGHNFHLTFAAGGPLQAEVQERVQIAGMASKVYFKGGFHAREVNGLLECHEVFVSSSLSDGTSISLLEAMAGGLFPVVSRIPSNQSWFRDNTDALMFDPGNAFEAAEQLRIAFMKPNLRTRAAGRNRLVVEAHGNRKTNLDTLLRHLAAVALEFPLPSITGEPRRER